MTWKRINQLNENATALGLNLETDTSHGSPLTLIQKFY